MELFLWIYGILSVLYLVIHLVSLTECDDLLERTTIANITNVITLLSYIVSFPTRIIMVVFRLIYMFLTCDFRDRG